MVLFSYFSLLFNDSESWVFVKIAVLDTASFELSHLLSDLCCIKHNWLCEEFPWVDEWFNSQVFWTHTWQCLSFEVSGFSSPFSIYIYTYLFIVFGFGGGGCEHSICKYIFMFLGSFILLVLALYVCAPALCVCAPVLCVYAPVLCVCALALCVCTL